MPDIEFRLILNCDGPVDTEASSNLRQKIADAIAFASDEGALISEGDEGSVVAVTVEPYVRTEHLPMGAAEFELLEKMADWGFEVPMGSGDGNLSMLLDGDWDWDDRPLETVYNTLLNLKAVAQLGQQIAQGDRDAAPAVTMHPNKDASNDMVFNYSPAWIDVPGFGTLALSLAGRDEGLTISHWWGDHTQDDPDHELFIPKENQGLTPDDWQYALDAQSACNASGLIAKLEKLRPRIWVDVRAAGGGTSQFNKHPIMVLFTTQFMHLSGLGIADMDIWSAAEAEARKQAGLEP